MSQHITCPECGLEKPHKARGLCRPCYSRCKYRGDELPPLRRGRFSNTVVSIDGHAEIVLETRLGVEVARAKVNWADIERLEELDSRLCLDVNGYVIVGRHVLLHRFLMGAKPGQKVDHEDGDPLDNRHSNLRFVTKSENGQNRSGLPANNTSGYRGVSWNRAYGKWEARVKFQGKSHSGGSFDDVQDANRAAIALRNRLFTHHGGR